MASTTCRCGFLASRQATSATTTSRPGGREQAPHGARREAGMALAVAGGHLVLLVLIEAQQDQPSAGTQHPGAFLERAGRVLGIGQRVKHQHGVERGGPERQLVHVGDLSAGVGELRQPLLGQLDHAGAGVDAGERAAIRRERRCRRAVARADVEHVAQLEQGRDPDRQRLPGAAGRVVPLELVRDRFGQPTPSLGVELGQSLLVAQQGRVRRASTPRRGLPWPWPAARRPQARKSTAGLAGDPARTRPAQPPQVGRHPRLRNPRDAHQVRDTQLPLAQQRAQPDAALVAQQTQRLDRVGKRHKSCYWDERIYCYQEPIGSRPSAPLALRIQKSTCDAHTRDRDRACTALLAWIFAAAGNPVPLQSRPPGSCLTSAGSSGAAVPAPGAGKSAGT